MEFRTVLISGEPWFVAKDVCEALELGDVSKAVSRLDDDEKGTNSILTLGGQQEMLTVSESGLYSLIGGSRKPEAKQFKKWVNSVVLPSIRKTGSYSIGQIPSNVSSYLAMTEEDRAIAYFIKEKEIKALSSSLEEAKPKVEFVNQYVYNENFHLISTVAKLFGIAQRKFFNLLHERRIIYKKDEAWMPYSSYEKYFKITTGTRSDNRAYVQTRFTSEGIVWIADKLKFNFVDPNNFLGVCYE